MNIDVLVFVSAHFIQHTALSFGCLFAKCHSYSLSVHINCLGALSSALLSLPLLFSPEQGLIFKKRKSNTIPGGVNIDSAH